MAAIADYPATLEYASNRVRSVKSVIQMAVTNNIRYLSFASESILSDREFLLDLIKNDHSAYTYASRRLKCCSDFNKEAIKLNPRVRHHVESFYKETHYGNRY